MMNLIKSAEVYGSEAIVYNGSNAPPDLYIDLIVNNKLVPGMGAGYAYGKGVYTTYNLSGTATASGEYGAFVYKLKVNLYGFISFNPDITRKIYGEDLTPSQQYEKIYGRRDYIFKGLKDLESRKYFSEFSSDLARPVSKFLKGIVKGLIFTGRNDGDVAVIYDPLTIIPIAWKKTEDSSWSSFDKDQIKPAIGRGTAGSFEKSKYDEVNASKDRGAKESISILSNFHGDNPGKKEIDSVNYLIANAPITFLSEYSKKDWAKDYIKAAVGRSLFVISPEEFLKKFKNEIWFEENSGPLAKRYAESDPDHFLQEFANESWAQEYIPTAAERCAEKEPEYFLNSFKDYLWAEPYITTAAKNYAKRHPYDFLKYHINEPWAEPHIPIAAKSGINKDPYYFLISFSHEPWAKDYLPTAAKNCAKENPCYLLRDFTNEPWAKEHINIAAENCAKKDPFYFLADFSHKSWAEPHIPTAAENYAEKNPDNFLLYFRNDDWAQPYLASIRENMSKDTSSILPTASNRSTKILKLSKALLSLGHIKEMIVIRSLVSE